MNQFKDIIEEDFDCPEKEVFLDSEDLMKGYGYYPSKKQCIHNYMYGSCEGSCNQKFLYETTLYLFEENAANFGFKSFESVKEEIIDGKKITTTENVVGFFSDENRHSAFIHWTVNRKLLPATFSARLNDLTKVDAVFEGENFTLLKVGGGSFAINSNLHRNIKEMISVIDSEYVFTIREYQITPDGSLVAIKMDEDSLFIIAGMLGYTDFAEEERLKLMEKVDTAQPFFNFSPYKKVDWSKLKKPPGNHFESLCEIILTNQKNITDIQPIGKTNASDRGRDFIIKEKSIDINGKSNEIKWLVQCKFSENSISPKTVPDWTNRVIEHNVDGYWLVTNNDLTPDLIDQLKDAANNHRIKIQTKIWQRNKFDTLFNTQPELFTNENFNENTCPNKELS
ncbi:MAG TPA: restriction endonuclease [Draconibacterium sp.]|nr:restriction endonuclease [Draconibacterium sp.]